jgi:hypothetical protein
MRRYHEKLVAYVSGIELYFLIVSGNSSIHERDVLY